MSKESPKISVVIPAFNEEKMLPLCLKSLRNQDFRELYEIIVVDNASSDKTAEIARSFGVKVIYEPKKGTCRARQAGVMAARAKIIAGTDADCIVPSDWLSKIFERFNQYPRAVGVAGRIEYEGNAPWWLKAVTFVKDKILLIFFRAFGKTLHISSANFSFKKEALLQVGGYRTFFPSGPSGGDQQDILFRLQKIGPILIAPEIVVRTSTRRYRRGLLYALFVGTLWFGLINYLLTRFFHRSPIGQSSDVRD